MSNDESNDGLVGKTFTLPSMQAELEELLKPGPEDDLDITHARVVVRSGHVVLCNRCTSPLIAIVSSKEAADGLRDRHAELHRGKNRRIMEILGEANAKREAAGKPVA